MATKTAVTQFQSAWAKTSQWAQQNKIPVSAYLPVYQADSQRLLSGGSAYSQSERWRAVAAAAGLNYSTSLPQDNPNPSNVLVNVQHNLESIFTGLNPVNLAKNMFDTVTNTIQHPDTIVSPLAAILSGNTTAFSNSILAPHSIWAFVPGAYDVGELARGKAGIDTLLTNPITAITDVIPVSRLPMGMLARSEAGAAMAERIGVHPNELAKLMPAQLSWKLTKSLYLPGKDVVRPFITDAGVSIKKLTSGERVTTLANSIGMGHQQGELMKELDIREREATEIVIQKAKPMMEAFAKLSPEGKPTQAEYQTWHYLTTQWRQTDFRPIEQVMNDHRFSVDQREAIRLFIDFSQEQYKLRLSRGDLVGINTPYGVEFYLADGKGAVVQRAVDVVNAAQQKLNESSAKFDNLMAKNADLDAQAAPLFESTNQLINTVWQSIRESLPDLPEGKAKGQLAELAGENSYVSKLSSRRPKTLGLAKRSELSDLLGINPVQRTTVLRDNGQRAEAFSGKQGDWSQAELAAFAQEKRLWDEPQFRPPTEPYTTETSKKSGQTYYKRRQNSVEVTRRATQRMKAMGTAEEATLHGDISANVPRMLKEILEPSGLFEQMKTAYDNQDFTTMAKVAKQIRSKLNAKSLSSPDAALPFLQFRENVLNLTQYAMQRRDIEDRLIQFWYGDTKSTGASVRTRGKFKPKPGSIADLTAKFETANNEFLKVAKANPPAIWSPLVEREYTREWLKAEKNQPLIQQNLDALRREGFSEAEISLLHDNPQTLREIIEQVSESSANNPMVLQCNFKDKEIMAAALETIADMRAQGMQPMYFASVSPFDKTEGRGEDLYNISIGRTHVSSESATHERNFLVNSSIYNLKAGMLKEIKEEVRRNAELKFQEEYLSQFLFPAEDQFDEHGNLVARGLTSSLREFYKTEMVAAATGENREMNVRGFTTEAMLKKLNLKKYDPNSLFGIVQPRYSGGEVYYIDANIAQTLEKTFDPHINAIWGVVGKTTKLFRTSILGYSPRYLAHIAVGGTFMALGKSNPGIFKHISTAYHITKTGVFPPEIADQFKIEPERAAQMLRDNSTQEGFAETIQHHALGYSAGQFAIQESMARTFGMDPSNLNHPDWMTHYLKVVPNLFYRFTRFTTNMQRAAVFLDGADQAFKKKSFYETVYDNQGKATRVERKMTPDEALQQAMEHANAVMGDVAEMGPFERDYLTKAMPFWGWTKHVLKYVMSFPNDHPYRVMFLTQLARIGQQEMPSGLPLRTQLLFFLGAPSANGQVNAFDIRAANPLRDTANYMTLSGWLSALNPVLTAPFARVDPNITFGTNVMYPHLTYSSLYGSKSGAAAGNWFQTVESIVPEVTALDQAFNLSGQYAYLHQSGNRNAYYKAIFNSLNVPFLQEQSINLRQISATQEVDRYQQAAQAAKTAWQTGDFSGLSGYGPVPDPRNTQYNITPAELERVYNEYKAAYGLPPSEVAQPLPSPTY